MQPRMNPFHAAPALMQALTAPVAAINARNRIAFGFRLIHPVRAPRAA